MYYIICSTARSGSTLLAKTLAEMGAGKPEEFLNPRERQVDIICQSFMKPSPLAYMGHLKEQYSVNGIFALKAHYSQLAAHKDVFENFTAIFPDAKYISITRRNVLRRAVSASRARQTDAWTSAAKEKAAPEFSYIGIIKQLINNAQEIELWEKFYSKNNIKPLRILYEDLDENYDATVRRVIDFLGLKGDIPNQPIKRQSDNTTELWVERFCRFFRGDGVFSRFVRYCFSRK